MKSTKGRNISTTKSQSDGFGTAQFTLDLATILLNSMRRTEGDSAEVERREAKEGSGLLEPEKREEVL